MNILVVGNGGRECAMANALLLSPKVGELCITPANWGVRDPFDENRVRREELNVMDLDGLLRLAEESETDLTVVGPENPLAAGIVDAFRQRGLRIVGPDRKAARLEAEKSFAKDFMLRHGIPTGGAEVFTDFEEAAKHLDGAAYPLVLKADGLAAGKGVIICPDRETARATLEQMMVEDKFKGAGKKVLVEECLTGPEISFFCFFDGTTAVPMPPVSDYKRLKDGDEGPNTGGMGCMCPSPYATPEVVAEWREKVLQPFVKGCQEDGFDYRGVIYFGTMVTDDGLKVLEFNVRMGDPEAQAQMPLLQNDFVDVLAAMESGTLDALRASFSDEATVTVVLASANYPFGSSPPARIEGLERIAQFNNGGGTPNGSIFKRLPRVSVFFAGVGRQADDDEVLLASGGRVLAVTARGNGLSEARRLAYEAVGNIHFEGAQYRTDIALLR